jgi:hypothetical protein
MLSNDNPNETNDDANPLTLTAAINKNRSLLIGIMGFTGTELLAANLEAPELALPIIGWMGMAAFVSLFVIIEKSQCIVKVTGEDQSQSLHQVLKPFVCVFLPFILTGLTATPAAFAYLADDDQTQSLLTVAEDSVGLIAALSGLYKITPKEDWVQQRNHLLTTIAGFMILGLINAFGEINDAYSTPLAYDAPIPEQAVLPLSSMLAMIFAVTMTLHQSGSLECNLLTSLRNNVFHTPANKEDEDEDEDEDNTLTASLLEDGPQSNA